MNEGLIPRRYAKALFKVALERKIEERVYALMTTLAGSFAQMPELKQAVSNPFIDSAQKVEILEMAAQATEADTTYSDFLKLLIVTKRIEYMREIALAYLAIYRKTNGIYSVCVTSAGAITDAEASRIKAIISRHLPAGAKIEYTGAVDPELLGGFVVSIDNERLDASIKNELEQLRLKLTSI